MGLHHSPFVVRDDLVLYLDGANYKSFKGFAATNLLYSITNTYGEQTGANFKTSYGDETAYIPSLGYKTVRYCNIYNNYPTSGDCCPSILRYGGSVLGQTIAVSSSTTYTYQIIYKTTSGYTHPNFMYRYEFGASGYVTEGGVHSDSNRTSLGDGWYYAWGQFTTQSTTTYLYLTGMWYYQYGVYDKVSVAGVSLHQGTFTISPQNMLLPQENRGTTVATGGGWANLIGTGNHGELVNGVRESSDNLGALVFDGTNDYVDCTLSSGLTGTGSWTMSSWFKINGAPSAGLYQNAIVDTDATGGSANMICADWSGYHGGSQNQLVYASRPSTGGSYTNLLGPVLTQGVWYNAVVSRNGSTDTKLYTNGSLSATYSGNVPTATQPLVRIGRWTDGTNYSNCSISQVSIYNRALTAAEVSQNFNALRGRFGI